MGEKLKSLFKPSRNNERRILEHPHIGEASQFYFACRNGDIDTVKQMLPTIPYNELNHLEPNGSTALHAATYSGHLDIVRLLLQECSCQRHLRNLYGLTAYEEAQTDEMREVYHRPSTQNRFNDDSMVTKQTFQLVSSSINKPEMDDNDDGDNIARPNRRYLIGYETSDEVKKQLDGLNGVKAFFQSRVGRYIMGQGMKLKLAKGAEYGEEEYAYVTSEKFRHEALQRVLDEHVTSDHPTYKHCCHLLKEYIQHGSIESLLKLYTLETPFYRQLSILSSPLGFPFFMHLADLKQRYYQGYSYRGVQMTRHELDEYHWALKNKDSVLSLLTFSSTSIIRDVAEQFSGKPSSSDGIGVLFIFYFPLPCDTAINLSAIPEYQLSCISNFENEKEVLISPRTFFKVTKIESDRLNERYTIDLVNMCGEQQTVLKALKFFLAEDLKKKTSKLFRR